ncbi:hypothetical protein BDR05DRAFT_953652 [Suillus weaverae]|nr:hypothetical protein BDR05DRAFT_953652 [Suillus weaverae]
MSSGGKKCVQLLGHHYARIRLSKEAQALLTASHHEKSLCFRTAINNIWADINKSVKTISASNHKSAHQKKNQSVDKENRPSGKALITELINEHRVEYHTLSNDEKDSLLKEYKEHQYKDQWDSYLHKLNSLKCQTGTETILYTMCSSTELPLGGITFVMEGVDDFMVSVMNIDNQEFVTKMEGFALHGLCEEITKNPDATMWWVHYGHNVVSHYQVIVKGWPDRIPFDNLSKAASGITALEDLKERWKFRETAWRQLDKEEFQELDQEPCKKAYTSPATVESEDKINGTSVSSPNNTTLDTEPYNNAPVLLAGQPELGGTLFDGSGFISFQPSALTGTNGSFNLFYSFTQTSTDGLYLPSSSGNTGFVNSQLPDFNYEQAIMSLNQLLGGSVLTP